MSEIDAMDRLANQPMHADFAELSGGESMDGEVSINMPIEDGKPCWIIA